MRCLRARAGYALLVLFVMMLGLASRRWDELLPAFAARHAGDALWAAMVYLGFRCVLIRRPVRASALCGLLFSFGIECSQLYHAPWIDALRGTTVGALILGRGFLWADLARYTAGIAAAFAADVLVNAVNNRTKRS